MEKTWTLVSELDGGPVTYELLYKGFLNGVSLKYMAYNHDRNGEPYASGHYQKLEKIVLNGLDIAVKNDAEKIAREEIITALQELKANKC